MRRMQRKCIDTTAESSVRHIHDACLSCSRYGLRQYKESRFLPFDRLPLAFQTAENVADATNLRPMTSGPVSPLPLRDHLTSTLCHNVEAHVKRT